MDISEYRIEMNQPVDCSRLEASPLPKDLYAEAHRSLIQVCHDVFIEYNSGVLLIVRKQFPAKDILWPIGGRILRGLATIDSLQRKVKAECNLDLDKITLIGLSRTYFSSDPFSHSHGTDTINLVFLARGNGNLVLDGSHEQPTIVTSDKYYNGLRSRLHPYVRDYLDQILISKTTLRTS